MLNSSCKITCTVAGPLTFCENKKASAVIHNVTLAFYECHCADCIFSFFIVSFLQWTVDRSEMWRNDEYESVLFIMLLWTHFLLMLYNSEAVFNPLFLILLPFFMFTDRTCLINYRPRREKTTWHRLHPHRSVFKSLSIESPQCANQSTHLTMQLYTLEARLRASEKKLAPTQMLTYARTNALASQTLTVD